MLVMITVALWGLLLTQLAPSSAGASSGAKAQPASGGTSGYEVRALQLSQDQVRVTEARAITSSATVPLAHRVTFATRETDNSTYCETPIIVHNPSSQLAHVEVEWFPAWGGSSIEISDRDMNGGSLATFRATSETAAERVNIDPIFTNFNFNQAWVNDFDGFAYVYSDVPQISVSAFVVCRTSLGASSGGNVLSVVNVPVVPVGAALTYFQAEAAGTASPPAAIAETPEIPRKPH
jgi:hypothetical protein